MPSKVWLITGANSGIGLALAQQVLSHGDKVIATVRSVSKFPDSLKSLGAAPLVLDLNSSDAEIRKAGEEALKIYGLVDVLVNNAGYGLSGPVEELDMDEVRAQFQTNVFGAIAITQALLPHFRTRKTGHILNVTSQGAYDNFASIGPYSASKAALDAFSESLSREVAPFGVTVLVLVPGYFSTRWFGNAPAAGRLSEIYTAPEQGYDVIARIPKAHVAEGQIGDPVKLAERVYEVVHGVGLAEGLVGGPGWKKEWIRIPLGTDCGPTIFSKIQVLKENVEATEKIWNSTDVEPERLKDYPDG